MTSSSFSNISRELSKSTSFFGIKLWVSILISIGLLLVFLISALLLCRCRRRYKPTTNPISKPIVTRTISSSIDRRLLSGNGWDSIEMSVNSPESNGPNIPIECCSHAIDFGKSMGRSMEYSLSEIETATNGFADENFIGSGDHGIVYRGFLYDHTRVAVKKLISNSGSLKDFIQAAEEMWCVRHKNLVKLLGYCIEGTNRMLVYEYVDNGNLHHWLHESIVEEVSPLTWDMRINIILGIVKCVTYLHEENDHPIIHGQIKSGNILLDRQWNPKVTDLCITNLIGQEWRNPPSPSVGMSGFIAPEFACTCCFDEKTDIYSIGVLIMEIVSGKVPVECCGNEIEAYLVEWLNSMVMSQRFEEVLDPKLPEKPCMKELKRIVLIALRCIDPDVENRPKMGDILRMLQPRDLLLDDEVVLKI